MPRKRNADGGWRSRKLALTIFVLILIAGGFAATGRWPALGVTYSEYVMGLLAASSIYATGNSVAKVIQARAPKVEPKKEVAP